MKLLLLLISFLIFGCTKPFDREIKKGKSFIQKSDFKMAAVHLEAAKNLSPTTAERIEVIKELYRIQIFELKEFEAAIINLKDLILLSSDSGERERAQLLIAQIYLENLNNPRLAVPEFQKIIPFLKDSELHEVKFKLAKAYFYLSKFDEALAEVDSLLKLNLHQKLKFEVLSFKANILVSSKKSIEAANLFKEILITFPDDAIEASLPVTLSVTLEELKDFNGAIKILSEYKSRLPNPETIDIRVMRLKERSKNAPGARGIRK